MNEYPETPSSNPSGTPIRLLLVLTVQLIAASESERYSMAVCHRSIALISSGAYIPKQGTFTATPSSELPSVKLLRIPSNRRLRFTHALVREDVANVGLEITSRVYASDHSFGLRQSPYGYGSQDLLHIFIAIVIVEYSCNIANTSNWGQRSLD
ncbi:hypothetical protein PF008_g20477 [Phytophthora fragariae]|uniref:Uncharacterized protein n=1 Tax=Phytophthora fragariae TaxID=53985 RepID=A0A6G0QZE1_9STRA|nr:hypothetical protein PF008_g20477 [Phytophthora fragariae]